MIGAPPAVMTQALPLGGVAVVSFGAALEPFRWSRSAGAEVEGGLPP